MAITVEDLIAQVRQRTMTTNNNVVTDDEVAEYLSDALKVLYDIFVENWQHWFFKSFSFTLAGGVGGNSVPLPVDFQVDLGLNLNPLSPTPTTVPRLSTFNQRNDLAQWGTFNPNLPGVPTNRRYVLNGDELVVLPVLSAQGDYELFYQAQIADLALTKTRSFAIDASDHPTVSGSGSAFVFANGGFDAARDVGAVFTVTFDAPNALFSGTYMITAVNSPTSIDTDPSVDPFTFTGPAAGPDVVETYQPVNTINVLPQVINPWQLFLKAHAACTVNAKRDLTNPDIQRTVDQEHARAVQMAQKRTSDLKQSPITRGQGNPLFGPWDGGAFGDGW